MSNIDPNSTATLNKILQKIGVKPNEDSVVGKKKETKTSAASYYQFKGDERALSGVFGLSSMGTNQKEPTPTATLLRQAWISAADSLAKQIVSTLEKS